MKYNDLTPKMIRDNYFYEPDSVQYVLNQYNGDTEEILSNEDLEYYAYNFTDLSYGISIILYNIGMTIVYCSTDKQYLLDNADNIYNDFVEALNADSQSESDKMLAEIPKKYNVIEFDSETESNLLRIRDALMLDDTLENTLMDYETVYDYTDLGKEIVDILVGTEFSGKTYVINVIKSYKYKY